MPYEMPHRCDDENFHGPHYHTAEFKYATGGGTWNIKTGEIEKSYLIHIEPDMWCPGYHPPKCTAEQAAAELEWLALHPA